MSNMTDLEWLARNVHEWPAGAAYIAKHESCDRWCSETASDANHEQHYDCYGKRYTYALWLAECARIQNKPSWADAPEWAEWLAQDADGQWVWYPNEPRTFKNHWSHLLSESPNRQYAQHSLNGEVLGDWRDTLDRRPASSDQRRPAYNQKCRLNFGGFTVAAANTSEGMKFDGDKSRFDLIPPTAERLLADVLAFGAKKYAPDNWRKVPDAHNRYVAAALRHINAHRSGEQNDTETGLPHLAHAMCCLAFIIELEAV